MMHQLLHEALAAQQVRDERVEANQIAEARVEEATQDLYAKLRSAIAGGVPIEEMPYKLRRALLVVLQSMLNEVEEMERPA